MVKHISLNLSQKSLIQSKIKYNISPIIHFHFWGKMDLEAHFQNLASLNINPDEIENEQHAKAFNSLFAIVEILRSCSKIT
jgi:hypothetical protein